MTAQTPLQSKELYDEQAPIQPQVAIPSDFTDILAADYVPTDAIATDGALTTNSDAKIPSQKAVKTYVDALGTAIKVNANRVADVSNSATGTQLATAINGILAILISAGLMKSS